MDMKKMLAEFLMEFGMLGIVFVLIFVVIFILFITIFSMLLSRMKKNKRSPKLTVCATVVDKRVHYSRNVNSMDGTDCYVTFEVESGDRLVLDVTEYEFGLLVEGDRGMLTFQGSRFCDFERKIR